jgi:hypothetical protein
MKGGGIERKQSKSGGKVYGGSEEYRIVWKGVWWGGRCRVRFVTQYVASNKDVSNVSTALCIST